MDRLKAMQTFVRVVETGSFSAVGRETSVSQSAVSKQVAALERALGAPLLVRTTRALALTEAGERYFNDVRRLVSEITEAETQLLHGQNQLSGWLNVAASTGFSRLRLLPLIQSFQQAYPDVRVELKVADQFVNLIEQGIDVAVRFGELDDSGLIARRVGTSRRLVVAHRKYLSNLPKGLNPPECPSELAMHDCIVYTGLAKGNAWSFTAGLGAKKPEGNSYTVRVKGPLQTNSTEVAREAVLAGMGIGYAPDWFFKESLASGDLQVLLTDWEAPQLPIHLVYPPERRHTSKVKLFSDHIAGLLE